MAGQVQQVNEDFTAIATMVRRWKENIFHFAYEALGMKPHGTVKTNEDDVIISNQQEKFFIEVNRISFAKWCLQTGAKNDNPMVWEYAKKTGLLKKAAKGTGKDFELSVLCLWGIVCWDPIKIACVAPTGAQLKTILWSEIKLRLAHPDCKVKDWVEVTEDFIYARCPVLKKRLETRQMFGRTAKVTAEGEATTLSGMHCKHMLLIFDEASRIPDAVFDPLDNTTSDPWNWVCVMYNPEKRHGYAYDADMGKMKDFYVQMADSFLDTDRLTEDQKAVQIAKLEAKYGGRDTNGFKIYVKGEYPGSDGDGFIPWNYAWQAMEREPYDIDPSHPIRAGIDPGLLKDKTIVSVFQGPNQIAIVELTEQHHHNNEFKLAECIVNDVLVPYNVCVATIELDGIGHPTCTILRPLCKNKGIALHGVNMRDIPAFKAQYYSKKEELYDLLRVKIVNSEIKLLPDEDQLAEITAIRQDGDKDQWKGKLKLIANKTVGKILKRSPDKASGLILAVGTDDRAYIRRAGVYDKYGINALPWWEQNMKRTWMSQ